MFCTPPPTLPCSISWSTTLEDFCFATGQAECKDSSKDTTDCLLTLLKNPTQQPQTAPPMLGSTLGSTAPATEILRTQGKIAPTACRTFKSMSVPNFAHPWVPYPNLLHWKKSSTLAEARQNLGTPESTAFLLRASPTSQHRLQLPVLQL